MSENARPIPARGFCRRSSTPDALFWTFLSLVSSSACFPSFHPHAPSYGGRQRSADMIDSNSSARFLACLSAGGSRWPGRRLLPFFFLVRIADTWRWKKNRGSDPREKLVDVRIECLKWLVCCFWYRSTNKKNWVDIIDDRGFSKPVTISALTWGRKGLTECFPPSRRGLFRSPISRQCEPCASFGDWDIQWSLWFLVSRWRRIHRNVSFSGRRC